MRIFAEPDHTGFGPESSLLEADGHDAAYRRAFLGSGFVTRRHGQRLARIADIDRRGE
ncbi:MAG TPA: hypothetical protein VGV57_06120 [Thermoleophilaceae bacterium]|nr:hypothetical protein [Thermoleophilaceae bacterium]